MKAAVVALRGRRCRILRRRSGRAEAVGLAALLVLVVTGGLLGCGGGGAASSGRGGERSGKLIVLADSYPLAYFAGRIGGELVEARFPAPSGVDPSFWSPDAETIARYQAADLVLVNGAGFAKWVETASLPSSRVSDTSAGFVDRLVPIEGAVTHSHGGLGEHSHAGFATHVWLDPTLAAQQATSITEALEGLRPESAETFRRGLAALQRDLEGIDARLTEVAARIGDTPLLFSHPVYAYLIRRYGLVARSLNWDPSEVPGYFALSQLDEKLEDHPAQLLIWEAEPVAETRELLAGRGIASLVLEPLANAPASGDFLSVMAESAARLEAAFPVP